MAELTIITNNVPRDILNGWELSSAERSEFDYIPSFNLATFFRYKDEVYDLQEFELVRDTRFDGWHGIQTDSFFSGILVRYTEDNEQVIVGRYYT